MALTELPVTNAYLLWHTNPDNDDSKLIGVFSTRKAAEESLKKSSKLPGFSMHSKSYTVDDYKIDKMYWETGFSETSD